VLFIFQLHMAMASKNQLNTVSTISAAWSFLHLGARILVVSLAAAEINIHAHRLEKLVRKCPNQFYTDEVGKTNYC